MGPRAAQLACRCSWQPSKMPAHLRQHALAAKPSLLSLAEQPCIMARSLPGSRFLPGSRTVDMRNTWRARRAASRSRSPASSARAPSRSPSPRFPVPLAARPARLGMGSLATQPAVSHAPRLPRPPRLRKLGTAAHAPIAGPTGALKRPPPQVRLHGAPPATVRWQDPDALSQGVRYQPRAGTAPGRGLGQAMRVLTAGVHAGLHARPCAAPAAQQAPRRRGRLPALAAWLP